MKAGLYLVYVGQHPVYLGATTDLPRSLAGHAVHSDGAVHPVDMIGRELLAFSQRYKQRLSVKLGRVTEFRVPDPPKPKPKVIVGAGVVASENAEVAPEPTLFEPEPADDAGSRIAPLVGVPANRPLPGVADSTAADLGSAADARRLPPVPASPWGLPANPPASGRAEALPASPMSAPAPSSWPAPRPDPWASPGRAPLTAPNAGPPPPAQASEPPSQAAPQRTPWSSVASAPGGLQDRRPDPWGPAIAPPVAPAALGASPKTADEPPTVTALDTSVAASTPAAEPTPEAPREPCDCPVEDLETLEDVVAAIAHGYALPGNPYGRDHYAGSQPLRISNLGKHFPLESEYEVGE